MSWHQNSDLPHFSLTYCYPDILIYLLNCLCMLICNSLSYGAPSSPLAASVMSDKVHRAQKRETECLYISRAGQLLRTSDPRSACRSWRKMALLGSRGTWSCQVFMRDLGPCSKVRGIRSGLRASSGSPVPRGAARRHAARLARRFTSAPPPPLPSPRPVHVGDGGTESPDFLPIDMSLRICAGRFADCICLVATKHVCTFSQILA